MKENVSGCFFSEHSGYTRVSAIAEGPRVSGTLHWRLRNELSAVGQV